MMFLRAQEAEKGGLLPSAKAEERVRAAAAGSGFSSGFGSDFPKAIRIRFLHRSVRLVDRLGPVRHRQEAERPRKGVTEGSSVSNSISSVLLVRFLFEPLDRGCNALGLFMLEADDLVAARIDTMISSSLAWMAAVSR